MQSWKALVPWLARMAWEEPTARSRLGVETGPAPLQSRNLQSQREANLAGLHWYNLKGFRANWKQLLAGLRRGRHLLR